MLRTLRAILLTLMLGLTAGSALGFSLLGPIRATTEASWQTIRQGYLVPGLDLNAGPMNLGEEYRWNIPTITYAYEQSFLNYFGEDGLNAIEQAVGVFNALPPVSSLPANLRDPVTDTELFPMDTRRVNFQATALQLLDLKSSTMQALIEELGLAQAERFVWTIRDINVIGANPPTTNYSVIQRNFDPITLQPTAFVNGTLYTYQLLDPAYFVNNAAVADAVEIRADTLTAVDPSAVANIIGLNEGQFYTGLTRDDVGGLRYLYRPNNVNVEQLVGGAQAAITNDAQQLITTQDLALLTERSGGTFLTPTNILALYPGIIIATTNSRLTNIMITNYVGPTPVVTNVFVRVFDYTYANTVTNSFTNKTWVTYRLADVQPFPSPGPNFPQFITNIISNPSPFSGGAAGAKARTLIAPVGVNNNFGITNNANGTTVNGTRVFFYDDGTLFGNAAIASYDDSIKELAINIKKDVTDANAVVAAINFLGPFTAGLTISGEVGGTNNGSGVLGANVSVRVLEDRVSGEFYIVPAGVFGFVFTGAEIVHSNEVISVVITNFSAAFTNTSAPTILSTIDLTRFLEYANTNAPGPFFANFLATFTNATALPNVIGTNSYFTNQVVATIGAYFTNSPINPATLPPQFVVYTNFSTNVVQRWVYTFDNLVTNTFSPRSTITTTFVTFEPDPFSPATLTNLVIRVLSSNQLVNLPSGSIYFIPTNTFGYQILSTQLIQVQPYTNTIFSVFGTNGGGVFSNTLVTIRYTTNFYFNVAPIQFVDPTNALNTIGVRQERVRTFVFRELVVQSIDFITATNALLRRGVDKINFLRVNFDSLLGSTFQPITNFYSNLVGVVGSSNTYQLVRRVISDPDIVFAAEDLGVGISGFPFRYTRTDTTAWLNNDVLNGNGNLAGPGIIVPPTGNSIRITFNKVGFVIINQPPFFLDEYNGFRSFVWGSFDGSTNAPIVYPSGSSIEALEQLILSAP